MTEVVHLRMGELTAQQRDVLGQIACGQDGGHHPRVLAALERKGLIVRNDVPVVGLPHLTITRWEVPVAVHIQWAAWCAEQPDEEVPGD